MSGAAARWMVMIPLRGRSRLAAQGACVLRLANARGARQLSDSVAGHSARPP